VGVSVLNFGRVDEYPPGGVHKHLRGVRLEPIADKEAHVGAMSDTVKPSEAPSAPTGEQRVSATAGLSVALTPRVATRSDGSRLEYFVSEPKGPVLVFINALGLGLLAWRGLLEHFSKSHQVICWKTPGIFGQPRTLQNHVEDLDLILATENVTQCQIVTWCSGTKVALEFFRRRPIASSMVFMNGAYMSLPGLERFETPFEQTMLKLCQVVARRPDLAVMVMSSMRALLAGDTPGKNGVASPLEGVAGLSELKASLIEPFSSVETTINYSRQEVDYVSHDIAPSLAAVNVPVLLLGGQNDRVSSADMSKAVAARLPNADYAEIENGTHYFLYEHPERVTALIDTFFQGKAAG